MEATGVLPFVRGVDLSGNDFKVSGRVAGRALCRPSLRSRPRRPPLPVLAAPAGRRGAEGGAGWGSPGARVPAPRGLP